ncbi:MULTISPECIES: HalOD1 output domain-containing protein [Halorussus]|uniref:HalOD1 output domain-containing protein n=1 Tax=Halorussus TaxID=1070314 RepID=UPI00209FEFCD|nr:HalOD1 output domain-containing protein [Halorussus vallis]USZ78084.1 hypothetical protein NGM07_20710 [Halorussus vallis]
METYLEGASWTVVERVAAAEGVEPTELTPPLGTVLDPEALDELVASLPDSTDPAVTFDYAGYEVAVAADGSVSVTPRDS